jgi:hypothetical protein
LTRGGSLFRSLTWLFSLRPGRKTLNVISFIIKGMGPSFKAVLEDSHTLAKLLSKSPQLAQARAEEDHLVRSIPHWIYVGDTPLHLASAGLRVDSARLLLDPTENNGGRVAAVAGTGRNFFSRLSRLSTVPLWSVESVMCAR